MRLPFHSIGYLGQTAGRATVDLQLYVVGVLGF